MWICTPAKKGPVKILPRKQQNTTGMNQSKQTTPKLQSVSLIKVSSNLADFKEAVLNLHQVEWNVAKFKTVNCKDNGLE